MEVININVVAVISNTNIIMPEDDLNRGRRQILMMTTHWPIDDKWRHLKQKAEIISK